MKRAYTDIPEGQMHYRHAGSGNHNVILLHMSGSSSDEFEQAGQLLARQGFHAFAIDLLGFGSSDRPPRYYTLSDHAGTVLEFMDSIGMEQAILYGNLATANMAVHMGVDHPERVSGLLLAHPLHSEDPAQYARNRFLPEYAVVHPKEDGSHLAELWARSNKYGESPQVCDARCRCLHSAADLGETLHWALFEDTPVSQLLPRLRVPTVVAAYSTFRGAEKLRELTSLIPDGKYDIYPGGTPYIARSHPHQVADMLTKHFPSSVPGL